MMYSKVEICDPAQPMPHGTFSIESISVFPMCTGIF